MSLFKISTPIAFIIFNRPDTTARVFSEIAKAKPSKLLVVADGPRKDRVGEAEKCAATRAIIDQVDWPCEVLTNYSDVNLGCKNRVSSGLNWVFEQVPEAIVLEDDCLPDPSFFRFCEEMLEKYRDDERIAMISGDNFQFGNKRGDASYYFSRYNHIWGWASWRRAWQYYDLEAKVWPELRNSAYFDSLIKFSAEKRFWNKAFQSVYEGKIDTWDYQWVLASWSQGMISIIPAVNLISNIGFRSDATHTQSASLYADLPVVAINFPLIHPRVTLQNIEADEFTAKIMFSKPRLFSLLLIIKKLFR